MKFTLGQILSVAYGKLLCSIDELYAILNYLTGDNLFTHQLPRAYNECSPWVIQRLPFLRGINVDNINKDNWESILGELEVEYGKYHELFPIPKDEHTVKCPLKEIAEMIDKNKIISILKDEPEAK